MSDERPAEELVKEAPEIAFCGQIPFGKYFRMGTSKGSTWQLYNVKRRTWIYLPLYDVKYGSCERSILLRDGWIIRKFEAHEQPYYYKCSDGEISTLTKDQALQLAYQMSPGVVAIAVMPTEKYLYLDLQPIYLPPAHYNTLRNVSVPIPDESLAREGLFCFRRDKLPAIRELFRKVRVRVEVRSQPSVVVEEVKPHETEQPIDIRTTVSDILTLAYSGYLKKEANIEKFLQHILNREWNAVHDEQLRQKLESLSALADQGSPVPSSIFDFLVKSASYVDYKFYQEVGIDSKIEGVIVDTVSLTYGETWSQNYYKIIFPAFESVLYWPTSIAPTRGGIGEVPVLRTRLKTVDLSMWRIYPYFGRLRKVGSAEDVTFVESSAEALYEAFLVITGIPTFEKLLSDRAYLGGFNVDLESWRGAYTLSRYFVATVRIIDPLTPDGLTPVTKVQDIFGNVFAIKWDLDTYFHCTDDIHKMQHGGWISVLLKNEFQNLRATDEGITVFESVPRIEPRFVNKSQACRSNLVAVVKYCAFLPKDLLRQIARKFIIDHDFNEILKACIERNWLYENSENIYYVYRALDRSSTGKMVALLTDTSRLAPGNVLRTKWYTTWSVVRANLALTHPIIYAEAVFPDKKLKLPEGEADKYKELEDMLRDVTGFHVKDTEARRRSRIAALLASKDPKLSYHSTLVGGRDIGIYVYDATLMLSNFGAASIEARGRWVAKAHTVAVYLTRKFAYLEPKVTRSDSVVTREDSHRVRTVKFEVESYGI